MSEEDSEEEEDRQGPYIYTIYITLFKNNK